MEKLLVIRNIISGVQANTRKRWKVGEVSKTKKLRFHYNSLYSSRAGSGQRHSRVAFLNFVRIVVTGKVRFVFKRNELRDV